MNILFLGDIMGRSGREVVFKELPSLKIKLEIDVVIINGENAAGGFGITPKICEEFYELGVQVITSGNHIWDKKDIIPDPCVSSCIKRRGIAFSSFIKFSAI